MCVSIRALKLGGEGVFSCQGKQGRQGRGTREGEKRLGRERWRPGLCISRLWVGVGMASRVLGLGVLSAPDRDYVPGQKRLSGRYAGIKTQQSRVLQCSMTVAVHIAVNELIGEWTNDRR